MLLQAGSSEMLRDEAARTAHKAHAAEVDAELELWPDMPHVFQVAPFLPESTRALHHIAAFVAARTGWSLANPASTTQARSRQRDAMAPEPSADTAP